MRRLTLPLLIPALLISAIGCPKTEDEATGPVGPPPGTSLRLTVVDDPALAQSIGYLQSEWKAQSAVAVEVMETSADEFDLDTPPQADIVVAPSWLLGPAAQAGWVKPLPDRVVQNNESDWSNIFPQLRSHEVAWGGGLMAVPFGSPVPVLYYRVDLLGMAGREAPATWADFQETAAALADTPPAAPLAEGWAGLMLLAHSSAYASHRDNLSTLFSISTMEPLIAGPAFVRGLEELAATANEASLDMDPAAVRAAFWKGQAAMAITWPTASEDEALADLRPDFPAGVVELPGSPDVYDVGDAAWEKREKHSDGRVPLLAAAGRIGVVTTTTRWPDAALQLLLWLTDEKWGAQSCSASPDTTIFRDSHVGIVAGWVERPMSDDAAQQYAEAVATALQRPQRLFALRIPGRSKYLAALDETVRAVVKKEKLPKEALNAASERWQQITEELGVEKQKAAYRASLGLK
jgi:multiple sugar transport system substrate-binding protein